MTVCYALEVFHANALYKFTFDNDADIDIVTFMFLVGINIFCYVTHV